jgi:nucleoside-diphosphate-sugar epimerase
MEPGEPELREEDAYPAVPDNEYGWEKLYAERMALAYMRNLQMEVRIARFQNCYGPEGTWTGGREKAPAAISRKVAEATDGGFIQVWGDGSAIRAYTYVDDLINGIYTLMQSDLREPTTIGTTEYTSVEKLVKTVIDISGKDINIKYVEGPVGVKSRNLNKEKIHSIGWKAEYSLKDGMEITYKWIEDQVKETQSVQD